MVTFVVTKIIVATFVLNQPRSICDFSCYLLFRIALCCFCSVLIYFVFLLSRDRCCAAPVWVLALCCFQCGALALCCQYGFMLLLEACPCDALFSGRDFLMSCPATFTVVSSVPASFCPLVGHTCAWRIQISGLSLLINDWMNWFMSSNAYSCKVISLCARAAWDVSWVALFLSIVFCDWVLFVLSLPVGSVNV